MERGNLFANIPPELARERFEGLFAAEGVRIERILSCGHVSPQQGWYDQESDEWVALLQGEARLEVEGEGEVRLAPGDWLLLRAHEKHRVTFTSAQPPCVWLAVHVPAIADPRA